MTPPRLPTPSWRAAEPVGNPQANPHAGDAPLSGPQAERLDTPCHLIMGASQGMGAAIARALAAAGQSLVLAARSVDALEAVAADCRNQAPSPGQSFLLVPIDFVSNASPDALARALAGRRLSGVLLNGGGPHGDAADSLGAQDLDSAHRLLFRGPVLHLQAALPCVVDGAQILAITSTTVLEPHPALTLSGAYRSALTSYLKSLSDALGPRQIAVNALAPGFVATDRLAYLQDHEARRLNMPPEAVRKTWSAKAAMGRIGSPEEIASLAAFIMTGGCPFLTGQTLVVDGGQVRAVR